MRVPVESIRRVIALFLLTLALPTPLQASERVTAMLNEDLHYEVSFLWFDKIAMARIRLQPGAVAGTYIASLEARTLGLSAFLTRQRRSRYESIMELAGGRLRPLRYEAIGSQGSGDSIKQRRTTYEFDYRRREIHFRKVKTGFADRQEIRPMPAHGLSDILTAFYNLRAGFVGPIVAGAEYTVPTMVSDEDTTINIRILDANERESYDYFPAGGYLCRVKVGRDIFGTEDGTVLVWFDDAGTPGRSVVEDVLSLGNVTGTLRGLAPGSAVNEASASDAVEPSNRGDR